MLIIDKAEFPRGKLCSGWITLGVLDDLKLDIADYAQGRVFQAMSGFSIGTVGGTSVKVDYGRTVSYGILRRQFDDYLLRRCGARLALGEQVKSIKRCDGKWTVNGQYQAAMLVAAGGHFCPVARFLGKLNERGPSIAAQELEIELTPAQESACAVRQESPELYFCRDLLGYGWCFRKGNHLNVGLGRVVPQQLPQQVQDFYLWLKRQGRLPDDLPTSFPGHAYLTYDQAARRLAGNRVVWIGDAAGLAHNESGEGIHPAIRSGIMAADAILAAQGDYRARRWTLIVAAWRSTMVRGERACHRTVRPLPSAAASPIGCSAGAGSCGALCWTGGSCGGDRAYAATGEICGSF